MAQLLIFDLDGTLISTMDRYADIAARTMETLGGLPYTEGHRKYLETSGIPFFMQIREIFPNRSVDHKQMDAAFEKEKAAYFDEVVHSGNALSPGVRSTLEYFRKRGKKLCISSNNYQNLVDVLAEQASNLFDEALGYRDGFSKGASHFQYLEEKFGMPRNSFCFIGDSLKDAEKAHACQVPFVALTGTFSKENFLARFPHEKVVESFEDLRSLFVGEA